jgi:DNA mismatch repair protein MutL
MIQRPASVIKELVDNAVDAGAHTINVIVVDAGRTSIQVIDDGCGMSSTDARLAFERHATSKIRKADDLFALHTMGFRGEALPSIAAVSQIELRTRRQGDEVGTCLTLSASRVESQEMCSCGVGSSFTVSNLFYNVPARRKFLKTNATELNNILTAFERIVLVYPEICFTLHSNGQELMNLKAGTLRQRITDVYGRRYGQELLPVSVETALCKISGFVAKPESARKKGAHEYFFVNGRFMKHAYFHKAVQQAYERLVVSGAHVPYFIYFDVNPADIDVNIHPTKTEIKFENEQAIWQILSAAVKDAIGQFCEIPQIDFDTEGRPEIPAYNPVATPVEMPHIERNPQYNPFREKVSRDWERLYDGISKQPVQQEQPLFGTTQDNTDVLLDESPATEQPVELTDVSPLHYQYKGRYIMTAVKSGLMIIDQHRADVRIRYERYMQQLVNSPSSSQRMLFPEVIEMAPSEAILMEEMMPTLNAVGFELTPLGPTSYAVNGVPAGIEGLSASKLLQDILDSSIPVSHDSLSINHQVALGLARHAAIPYGQQLSNEEMDVVVNNLFSCDDVNRTPDGKAILCILPQADIEHLLK